MISRIFRSFLLVACVLGSAEVTSWRASSSPELKDQERSKFPEPLFEFFYAVKNSLDYGVIEEIEGKRKPLRRLRDYSRVTRGLLKRVTAEFEIDRYAPSGDDYEIIVHQRSAPDERFRATRMETFVWHNGRWESLGGYIYF